MLTEEDTGYIINAAMKEFDNPKSNSVMNFAGGNVTVKGGMGRIDVSGADRVEVFTVNGFSAGTENLAPGMYIVRADGIVKKVIVR